RCLIGWTAHVRGTCTYGGQRRQRPLAAPLEMMDPTPDADLGIYRGTSTYLVVRGTLNPPYYFWQLLL
ncbi:hypothetical protein RF55_26642, partial [Lasius niger]